MVALSSRFSPARIAALVTAAVFFVQCSIDDANRSFEPIGAAAGEANDGGVSGAPSSNGGSRPSGGSGGEAGSAGGDANGGTSGEGGSGAGEEAGHGGESGANGGAPPAPTGGSAGGCTTRCNELGAACTSPNDCDSGRCVDGVCCETLCDGPCEACHSELTGAADGVCEAIRRDTDPDDECEEEPAASCGQTGACDGERACAMYDEETVCVAGSCAAGVQRSARTCDGAGLCGPVEQIPCAPYQCGDSACLDACGDNDDCAGAAVCVAARVSLRPSCSAPATKAPIAHRASASTTAACSGSNRSGSPAKP